MSDCSPKLIQRYYPRYQVSDGSEYAIKDDALAQVSSMLKSLSSVLLAPILLIIGTIDKAFFSQSSVDYVITRFFGNTVIVLLLSALYALIFLGLGSGMTAKRTLSQSKTSLKDMVNVLLIIGEGGGLKEMMQSTGLSAQIATTTSKWAIPTVLSAWLIATLFRAALWSGTVAVAAAAGIAAPMVAQTGDLQKALAVLAIAVGAMIFLMQMMVPSGPSRSIWT
ncbi:hypothetical protein J3U06_05540 [Bifidobacterium sp. B4142]|nr:hypothetical protein [Bifidobacterium sp. B4142]